MKKTKKAEIAWNAEDSEASLLVATTSYEDGVVELYQNIQTSIDGMQILYFFVLCSGGDVKMKSTYFLTVKDVEDVLLKNEKEINSFFKSADSLLSSLTFL